MGRLKKKKMQLIEELNRRLLNESNWKTCKKCMGTYSGSLDKCGFYATERFEENYGSPQGLSMGDNYFEGEIKNYDKIINSRLTKHIPNAWSSMNPKTKMQLWNFMFNSDSSNADKFRWLAVLYLTARKDINDFDESLTMKIINNEGSAEWSDAINLVNNTSSWDYSKFLKILDGQYRTYNPDTYKNTWQYRPKALDEMYNDCINGIDPPTINKTNSQPNLGENNEIVAKGNDLESFRNDIRLKTKGISIDWKSAKEGADLDNYTLTFKNGETKLVIMSLIWSNISKEDLMGRYEGDNWVGKKENELNIKEKNPNNTLYIVKGPEKSNGFWVLLFAIT